ncbi:hypothetical protein [Lacinutrix sp. Bg11-31]|uniref:hypothetical protein n=1 Tax=Lacinutrix sp. Bg11-31 TaxID=2057808 RepID=UPI000C319F01|nr:hypothetical protein [Lacinutrix sp. Bg11-31]AUC81904.1 hypothetical protein CW733_07085 [Lacinutrix sp. Bg11-31]
MKLTTLLFVFITSFFSYSQTSVNDDHINTIINSDYINNYTVENFYLHTNKDFYFTEENILFKAYVVHEEDNKPFLETTNLHVSLYNSNNELVLSELFYVKNGTANGLIKIPKNIKTGDYTIQLNTQWNRNFKEGALFPIEVYNINDSTTTPSEVENIEKLDNKELTNTELETDVLNKDEQNALTLNTFNKKNDIVSFQFKANSLLNENGKFAYAILHKKGTPKSVATITLKKNTNTYTLNYLKNTLYNGLNTVTVFDTKNKILAQTNYYNKPEKQIDITTDIIKESNDSISLDLKLLNTFNETNISISVLHEDSKVFDSKASITNTLLKDDESLKQINKIFPYKSPANRTLFYKNENGLKISGAINSKIENTSEYKVMLTSHLNNVLLTTSISTDKKFEFNNLLLKHPSDYKLALVDQAGKVIKGEFYIYKEFIDYKVDSIIINNAVKKPLNNNLTEEKGLTIEKNNREVFNYLPKSKNIESLEEVILKGTKSKKEIRIKEIRIKEIKKENPFLGISAGFGKDYYIDLEKEGLKSLVEFLEELQGIRVSRLVDGSYVIVNTRPSSISSSPYMLFFIDGAPMSQEGGLDLANYRVTDFEFISVNVSGAGYGLQGGGGAINLITRNDFSYKKSKNSFVKAYKTTKGFSLNQNELENNALTFPNLESEYYYSAIDWVPDFILKPNSANILKIKKPKNESVKLIINGFNAEGDLIHKVIHL